MAVSARPMPPSPGVAPSDETAMPPDTAHVHAAAAARTLRDFLGLVAERLEEGGLLPAGHDVDALPAAHFLAQLAADARLLVHLDLAEVRRAILLRRRDAVERADVDAHTAPVAVVGVDDRDRAPLALQDLGHIAERVEDRLVGADHP